MATAQTAEVGGRKTEFVVRRLRAGSFDGYLTARGGWTNNPELAQIFPSEGAAKKTLRNRFGEVVPRLTL